MFKAANFKRKSFDQNKCNFPVVCVMYNIIWGQKHKEMLAKR